MEQAVDFASNWVYPGLYADASFWYDYVPVNVVKQPPSIRVNPRSLQPIYPGVLSTGNVIISNPRSSTSTISRVNPLDITRDY